ncbi:MAG: hypothetical protein AB7O44_09800 [Hyphomicrobiaceae bacterium]
MLSIMIAENAKQQGDNMASVLDAVAAVMVKLTSETVCLPSSVRTQQSAATLANLLKEGIGRPAGEEYFKTQAREQIS